MTPREWLARAIEPRHLSLEETQQIFAAIMAGQWSELEIAGLLTALRVRGEHEEELAGAALALRECMKPLVGSSPPKGLLDTCGTGGDGAGIFNVSTAVGIVVSACGVPVAKHGNRGVSSRSGSADVLANLGVNLDAEPDVVRKCLDEIGLAFFFAPHWHPAMRIVAPVRRTLGFATVFNMLGPLCNPAGAEHQLIGVGRAEWSEKISRALARLGGSSAIVVAGLDGLDEVTLGAETHAVFVSNAGVRSRTWSPASFGLPESRIADWRADSPEASAAIIRDVLEGKTGPCRDLVLANAAAALLAAGRIDDLRDGVDRASKAIDSGAAVGQLESLVTRTRGSQA